ncbi:MAG: fused MFS/spermidine synthase [Spirochaetales bacterium]|nr:fused MFS/spermidine synthase [Spirochaetales bacterium]
MKKTMIYFIVFISGSAVLAVELLGTRILGPFYGVTLFLWSALITVTLAALSLGYFIGGYLADKSAKMAHMNWIMIGASAWILAIPFLKVPLLWLGNSIGIRASVLIAALGLFLPPLTLLGMISPFAIRVKTQALNEVGRSAGKLYAISTVGSVFAALVVGFFLIPVVGVIRLTLLTGIYLLIAVALGIIAGEKSIRQIAAAAVLLVIGIILLFTSGETPDPSRGLVSVRESNYGEIRVVDTDEGGHGLRYLLIDGCEHSVVDKSSFESVCPYIAVLDVVRYLYKEPGRLLLIGLGAGSSVKNYSRENWTVDTVEIDPVINEVAHEYFGLRESEGRVYLADGRQFLHRGTDLYDIIMIDAFSSSSIPFHMITREAFGEMKKRMKPDGILAVNIVGMSRDRELLPSTCATLKRVFPRINILPLPSENVNDTLASYIILASENEFELQRDLPENPPVYSMPYYMVRSWHNRYEPDTKTGMVITDDLNPVDIWSEAINLEDRKYLRSEFGFSGVNW